MQMLSSARLTQRVPVGPENTAISGHAHLLHARMMRTADLAAVGDKHLGKHRDHSLFDEREGKFAGDAERAVHIAFPQAK